MKATEFCKSLSSELQARMDAIVQGVRDGYALPLEWKMIEIQDTKRSVTLQIYVMCDALKLGESDDLVRINVNHRTQQQIADVLGVSMLTGKLADEIHRHADVVIAPITHNPDANAIISVPDPDTGKTVHVSMSSTTAMRSQSMLVEDKLKQLGAQPGQICSAVCKHWCNSKKLSKTDVNGDRVKNKGVNVGWHSSSATSVSPGGLHLIQPESDWHDWNHADYSQGAVYAHPLVLVYFGPEPGRCEVALFEEVIHDPVASWTLSYDGPLVYSRHPDVPPPPLDQVLLAPIPLPWMGMDVEGLTERRAKCWYPDFSA